MMCVFSLLSASSTLAIQQILIKHLFHALPMGEIGPQSLEIGSWGGSGRVVVKKIILFLMYEA